MVNLKEIISSSFVDVAKDIFRGQHTHYVFKGGRGSTKSSFISIMIPLQIMRNPNTNALVLRKTANTLLDSVYAQLTWALDMLGIGDYWEDRKSPLKLIYKPTGQQIIFRGADDPLKIKSIKPPFGYFAYIWYEEFHDFFGMDEIRSINQSAMRGGDKYTVFYSFNPPKSKNNWVNVAIDEEMDNNDTFIHHSTYLQAPREWTSEQFIIEAERLKEKKPDAYCHEYLGEAIGTGGIIFENVEVREITDIEHKNIGYFYYGIDWGFAIDPAVWIECGYDKKHEILYITKEIYGIGMSNKMLANKIIKAGHQRSYTLADSAEPKSIYDMNDYGLNIQGVKKWAGSVKNGIEWLQNLSKIIIDKKQCPNAAREFSKYEYDTDRFGNFISQYPDRDNHCLDSARYAMSGLILDQKNRLKK